MSKVVYKASCWDCQDFYIGKTKRRLHDRKTEHFKGITSSCHASAIAEHVTSTGHNLKWDLLEILAKGRSDTHCKIKETLLIQELKPTLNDTVRVSFCQNCISPSNSEANRNGADAESPFPLFFSFSASFKNSSPREKVGNCLRFGTGEWSLCFYPLLSRNI